MSHRCVRPLSVFTLLLVTALCCPFAGAQEARRSGADSGGPPTQAVGRPDVIFVPTPQPVVNEMLRLAQVKAGEKLYDLGCGDGRIVITAVRSFGARGVGVDIDPVRVSESRANARTAGVSDHAQFLRADLFEMDFRDADIVSLYLLPSLNLKLRPRLQQELRPGTRIVSYSFDMGDWQPDKRSSVGAGYQSIYLWIVPAQVAGIWEFRPSHGEPGRLELQQQHQKVAGKIALDGRTLPIRDGRLNGNELSFTFDVGEAAKQATLTINGDDLQGTVAAAGGERQVVSGSHRGKLPPQWNAVLASGRGAFGQFSVR